MKTLSMILVGVMLLSTSCKKTLTDIFVANGNSADADFVQYHIPQGEHYADQSTAKTMDVSTLHFLVKFDNTAIYQTADPLNQGDINKLYGFSDNDKQHHEFSARIGWVWTNNELQLFGYTYNNAVLDFKKITAVPIGQEITCSIQVAGSQYIFMVNGVTLSMPRAATTETGSGFKLYPYFGGDEPAPHDVNIWIKQLGVK